MAIGDRLGYCFESGQGTKPDLVLAAKWYVRAAAQGHPRAQYHLGLACSNGIGLPWNLTEACKWLMLAAQQHIAEAEEMLNTIKAPAEVRIEATHRVKLFQKVKETQILVQETSNPERPTHTIERQPGLDLWR